jgi:membrane protease YdiL (CAAX protease family)
VTPTEHRPIGSIRRTIANHPIASYVLIAFGASWAMTGLLSVSLLFGLLALFGPTVAAVVVSWGDGTLGQLRQRITDWRSPRLLAIGLGVPFAVSLTAAVLWVLAGHAAPEIGWRGFLMPRLRGRMSLPAAGFTTGVVWTLWHLPIYLQPGQGLAAFAVFAWWVVPFAIVMGFVAERARFSVLVATVMHGSANVALPILLPSVDHTWTMLATGTIYVLLAGALVVHSRSRSPHSSAARFSSTEVAA